MIIKVVFNDRGWEKKFRYTKNTFKNIVSFKKSLITPLLGVLVFLIYIMFIYETFS